MKAVNLYLLTRTHDLAAMSMLYQSLSGLSGLKVISPHEAACLCSLTDLLAHVFQTSPGEKANWLPLFDGFFFSYVIEHIGKEFDLLKISSDGKILLNIELKSEDIGEERIRKQLLQNRYYLSHTARTIYSFTYVMDTGTLYCMNEKGYLRPCRAEELAAVLRQPSFEHYLAEGIDRYFRSSDYLISPVASPERFLQGHYFLTNQQFDFKRRILQHLKEESSPVIAVTGAAGTGKTLLLFDLAMNLSRKDKTLVIHSGPLRRGHRLIDKRLRNVSIISSGSLTSETDLSGYRYILVDEADHLAPDALKHLLPDAGKTGIPVILVYDPHHLLGEAGPEETGSETASIISQRSTLSLSFSGNIRINRPVYSFLRTLLHLKEHPGQPDYSCIDVLYAGSPEELRLTTRYYTSRGYKVISKAAAGRQEEAVIAQEYDKVLMIMGKEYYYDDSLSLRSSGDDGRAVRLLYEGLSRTRDNLCLIVVGNEDLFARVLAVKLHQYDI